MELGFLEVNGSWQMAQIQTLSKVPLACVIQACHWLSCSYVIVVENSIKKKECSVNKAFGSKICNSSQAPSVTLGQWVDALNSHSVNSQQGLN